MVQWTQRSGTTSLPAAAHLWSGLRLCMCMVFMTVMAAPAVAQSSEDIVRAMLSRDGLPPHVTLRQDFCTDYISHGDYEQLLQRLALSDAQQKVGLELYEQYVQEIDVAFERGFERLLDGALGELVAELIMPTIQAGKRVTDKVLDEFGRDRINGLMTRIVHDLRRVRDQSARVRHHLEAELETILSTSQQDLLLGAIRAMRRDVLLQPRNPRGMHYDLDLLPDVIALYDEAIKPEQELSILADPRSTNDEYATLIDHVADVLEAYERQMDVLLLQSARREWELSIEQFTSSLAGDERGEARAYERKARAWRRLYDVTDRTVAQIGELVEPAIGPIGRESWLNRYHRVTFPELLCDETPELMYEWIINHEALEDDVKEAATRVYETYLQRRTPLRREAQSIRVDMRMNGAIHSLEAGIPDVLVDIEERREALAKDTNRLLRAQLADPETRTKFDRRLEEYASRSYGRVAEGLRY